MFIVRLARIRTLSESTRYFRFVRPDGETTSYKPGQFFRFVFEDAEGEFERSYSLCNFDELFSDTLDLVISKVAEGRASRLLFNCEAGIEARVTGPFGRLVLPDTAPDRLILVATSVGLAPYMPILKELEDRQFPEVVLLLGVRDRSEFLYAEELLSYAARHPWFELRLCLSREAARLDYEYDGYVTAQLANCSPSPQTDHILLCGNPAMIDDAWGSLKEKGFRPKQVVREKYVFAREADRKPAKSLSPDQKKLIAEKMRQYSKPDQKSD